jgi:HPt (histidine-containing phosphotransfer) domain-containing protein
MRTHADPRKAGVRIIALTAAVTGADVEACLAAGIDAVLGKPLQFEALQRLLVSPGAAPEVASEASPPPGPGPGPGEGEETLLDAALLDQHRALLGVDGFAALIPTLVEQCRALLDALRTERLPERQADLLHRLAGACSNFGLQAAAARCQALERAAADGEVAAGLPALEALLAASLERLAAYQREPAVQRA